MENGLPKESNVEEWRRSLAGRRKRVSQCLSRRQRGQRCVARHRVVWAWWQDLSFPAGLGAGKGALSCHTALDMLCQEMHDAWWRGCRCEEAICHSKKSLSLTVDGL